MILEKGQNIIFWKIVGAGFHAMLTCKPVQTSFQVDLEIYEDEFSQSGDRILSSHITMHFISLSLVYLLIQIFNITHIFYPLRDPLMCTLMPQLHLIRASHDLFVYDFRYDFSGIVGGSKLRRMRFCFLYRQ